MGSGYNRTFFNSSSKLSKTSSGGA
ncbi:hypothetical protein CY0110_16167 [Crocosphaera chwakensis CCY0110]|uniref:Uncharacterized protein n=1 Tax=Crocosphaera chwakensis CCY0110 TaxID=391612 RepID=A3IHR5_9CHRO|nr:hypothetical protein CY0110_16167 [Crocosphaera chwakensis CCY0110]